MVKILTNTLLFLSVVTFNVWAQSPNEKEHECLSFVAVLPVMGDPRMTELARKEEIYEKGGSSIILKEIQSLADEGIPYALLSLGALYESGYCVKKDELKASSLYKRAAERGSVQAQYQLGLMQTDCTQRINWWEQAAEQGYGDAQTNLAHLYRAGCQGISKDPIRALMWYTIRGITLLSQGFAPYELDEFTRGMTPAQIAEADRLAHEWINKRSHK